MRDMTKFYWDSEGQTGFSIAELLFLLPFLLLHSWLSKKSYWWLGIDGEIIISCRKLRKSRSRRISCCWDGRRLWWWRGGGGGCYETCMATRANGWDILRCMWGPRESKEEWEEHLLLRLLPKLLPSLPSFSSLPPLASGRCALVFVKLS